MASTIVIKTYGRQRERKIQVGSDTIPPFRVKRLTEVKESAFDRLREERIPENTLALPDMFSVMKNDASQSSNSESEYPSTLFMSVKKKTTAKATAVGAKKSRQTSRMLSNGSTVSKACKSKRRQENTSAVSSASERVPPPETNDSILNHELVVVAEKVKHKGALKVYEGAVPLPLSDKTDNGSDDTLMEEQTLHQDTQNPIEMSSIRSFGTDLTNAPGLSSQRKRTLHDKGGVLECSPLFQQWLSSHQTSTPHHAATKMQAQNQSRSTNRGMTSFTIICRKRPAGQTSIIVQMTRCSLSNLSPVARLHFGMPPSVHHDLSLSDVHNESGSKEENAERGRAGSFSKSREQFFPAFTSTKMRFHRGAKSADSSFAVEAVKDICNSFIMFPTPLCVTTTASGEEVVDSQDAVLALCEPNRKVGFGEILSSSGILSTCKKIGEGVYGEVFAFDDVEKGEEVVLKIIPVEGRFEVNGEKQKTFKDIFPELVITKALSSLQSDESNRTPNFVELKRARCICGRYPEKLISEWDKYDENYGSENDRPVVFGHKQTYIMLELENGGTPLELYKFHSAAQALSIFQQVAVTLAVAECALLFEHRDLHWGNILIKCCQKNTLAYLLDGHDIEVASEGVLVSIIDFTMSRMEGDSCAIFMDLSEDESLFTGQGDYQFEVYRQMRRINGNNWETFCPQTNIMWLNYLLKKLLEEKKLGRQPKANKNSTARQKLKEWHSCITQFPSAQAFVTEKLCGQGGSTVAEDAS